jgi:hypothetical protein
MLDLVYITPAYLQDRIDVRSLKDRSKREVTGYCYCKPIAIIHHLRCLRISKWEQHKQIGMCFIMKLCEEYVCQHSGPVHFLKR